MRWRMIAVATAAGALLAAACGGGTARVATEGPSGAVSEQPPPECQQASGGTLKVVAIDNEFLPTCLAVSSDQEIMVKHDGTYTHSFTIGAEEPFHTPFLLDLDPIESGDRVRTGAIGDSVEPGTYPFFCKFHAGMQGELWVTV